MIGDSIALSINSVAKTLLKINQDNYGATYFLREAAAEYTLTVKHTIPKGSSEVETHLFRLDVVDIVDGVRSEPMSVWLSCKTNGAFDSTVFNQRIMGLVDELDSTLVGKLINRES